jgi:hypothetical protein
MKDRVQNPSNPNLPLCLYTATHYFKSSQMQQMGGTLKISSPIPSVVSTDNHFIAPLLYIVLLFH